LQICEADFLGKNPLASVDSDSLIEVNLWNTCFTATMVRAGLPAAN
jgi:hypothetical protein